MTTDLSKNTELDGPVPGAEGIADHPVWDEMVAEFGDPLSPGSERTAEQEKAVAKAVEDLDPGERRSSERPAALTVVRQPKGTVSAPRTSGGRPANPRARGPRNATRKPAPRSAPAAPASTEATAEGVAPSGETPTP